MSAGDEDGFPLDHLVTGGGDILGIVSDLDDRGLEWLAKRLQGEFRRIFVIVSVYAGCQTRCKHLSGLLDLQEPQEDKKTRPEFRILPMDAPIGAPANCLTVLPEDRGNSVFLFGSTPNLGSADPDPTQFCIAFQAAPNLTGVWARWFDSTWQKAVPLTESTARIPYLVPAAGSSEAATRWRDYCQRLKDESQRLKNELSAARTSVGEQPEPEENANSSDQDLESLGPDSTPNQKTDQTPSESVGIPKLDEIAERAMHLVEGGKQVTIDHRSAAAPLEVSFPPNLLRQNAENRVGTVIQRQSFRISAFSPEELKLIEKFRNASRTIVSKLSLPMGTGLYWMPSKMIPIFRGEFSAKNAEAKENLKDLVGSNAHDFVESKKKKIEQDLYKTYRRLGGKGILPTDALTAVLDLLGQRIREALALESILARVTFSSVNFDLQQDGPQESESPWAQVEKLILALAKFPRMAIAKPKSLSGLVTPEAEILDAMNIADDVILKGERENRRIAKGASSWDLVMIDKISEANIKARSRCQACFKMIGGATPDQILSYISREELPRNQ